MGSTAVGTKLVSIKCDRERPELHSFPTRRSSDLNGLTKIAKATGGQEYTGTPQNIQQVFIQISEFSAVCPYILALRDRKSTRLNSSHPSISYAVFRSKKKTPRG